MQCCLPDGTATGSELCLPLDIRIHSYLCSFCQRHITMGYILVMYVAEHF